MISTATTIYLCVVLLASIVAFVLYGWDKRQAKLDRWRVPEERLHFLGIIGGWPGALAGQRLFRHKTQKLSFKMMMGLSIGTHVAILILLVFYT